MYYGHSTNEGFYMQGVGRCGGRVTATCPFANHAFDAYYENSAIFQLEYLPSGNDNLCVAAIGSCNDPPSGTGGDQGTIFIFHGGPTPGGGYMISLFFTNEYNNKECMYSDDTLGHQVILDLPTGDPTGDGCTLWEQTYAD